MATCIFALSWLFYLKLHRKFLYRLAAYQVVTSLLHALFCVWQFAFVEYDDSKYTECAAVGYLFTVAVWMNLSFGYWTTWHLLFFCSFLEEHEEAGTCVHHFVHIVPDCHFIYSSDQKLIRTIR